MPFAVQTSYSQTYQYGRYNSKSGYTDTAFDTEFMGKATSRTTSSSDGKNICIMTIGNRGFIAEYADSSTEQDPIIKVGDYEVRVNDVDPKNATEIEMFALTSYMDDKGLTGNTGMKTFNKMRAYSSQAEYNGFCNGIADPMTTWSQNRDWTAILQNAKETYLAMPKAYEHGLKCQSIIDSLESWSGARFLKRAQSGDIAAAREIIEKYIANGPTYRNQFYELADQGVQQKNGTGLSGGRNSEIRVSNFKEVETANYKLVPEPEIGGLRILVDGKSAGVFKPEHLKIQEDAQTGTRVMISELPGFNGNWYDAIPVTEELESALSEAIGVEEVPHQPLEGYYIGTHAGTGIKYVMRPGDEGRGGQVLLCNAVDEARFKALSEEYERRYPNLMSSSIGGAFYASLEIRGMAHRGANGIITTHPDGISYNDNDDPKKNWSAKIDEKTWNLLLGWFENHSLDHEKMTGFKYWDDIFNQIGGSYERIWSDDELKQGYLYQ
ncbi:MAG: hypothetical protein K6G87_04015 [Butyrivibrio sp.]|uniref:hypothetical protein n=1 Tax=Butyrivibrio sp. TaxID=28121 RepID=UPI0025EFC705|nr:hypothetical protein [Butyrivibrio sp.]MCR5770384.1 hypothetical protein [Butyrivibrio sp.]